MDIITHTLSGIAIGSVLSNYIKGGKIEKLKVIIMSGFGGAFPDIDSISLWSGFDRTFGKLFGLKETGKTIYFSKFWYSHHGFFHSILAGILIAMTFLMISFLITKMIKKERREILGFIRFNFLIYIGFVGGYVLHLLEDMPTPSCVWGGVRFLWPLNTYFGGSGDIWWWNNYDIFIIIVISIIVNFAIIGLQNVLKIDLRRLTIMTFLIALILCFIQIKTREFDFNYQGQTSKFAKYEQKSLEKQKDILGVKIYRMMVKFDKGVRVNF